MNKKGEKENTLSLFIVGTIAVIVGLILLSASANNVYTVQNTASMKNTTITLGTQNTYVPIAGYQLLTNPVITNGTATLLTNTDVVVVNFGANGLAQAYANSSTYAGKAVNISAASAEPYGYDENSGSRTMAGIIVLFGALACGLIFLWIAMKDPIMQSLGY